jgi:hypothetical protein
MKKGLKSIVLLVIIISLTTSCTKTENETQEDVISYITGIECNNLVITTNKYAETDDLKQKVNDEFGSNYIVADWNDIKKISNIVYLNRKRIHPPFLS